ncbi:MAG: 2-C-methyl-D-erythritol 4-phosphate cytidylyltransferase [Pyrinomonadaceae bacterium]
MNTAIIVAAGTGKRFGSKTPKQFLELHGKPVLIHSLEQFERCEAIDEIILVLAAAEIEDFRKNLPAWNFTKVSQITTGGRTRAESVKNGLDLVNSENTEVVAVHDGARPLVSPEEISRTVSAAKKTGAACLVVKVTDTVKLLRNGMIAETVNRDDLVKALTPQCFRYDLIKRGFEGIIPDENVTDECFLIEKLGLKIEPVYGSSRNIKITHQEDLRMAESLLGDGL